MNEPRYIVATCPKEGPERFFPIAQPGGGPVEYPDHAEAMAVGEQQLRTGGQRAFQIWTVSETYEIVVEIKPRLAA
jgi:hypothetical protein